MGMPAQDSCEDAMVDLYDKYLPSKKLIYTCMGFLVVYVIVRGIVGAAAKPLWFDELLTLAVAGQPNLHALWNAVSSGFDAQPPLFDLVERVAMRLASNKEVALRLPSIFAFPCVLICVFICTKKRSGELIAFLCALILLSTNLFQTYSIEARPYSMVIACIAFALVCYQRLPSSRWAAMLGISLLIAESLHYYAILSVIPFGLAETALLLKTRQFRWPVWLALVFGLFPLIVFWPLLRTLRMYYGAISPPAHSAVLEYYNSFFPIEGALGVSLAAVSVAAIACSRVRFGTAPSLGANDNDVDLAEGTLLVSLSLLPLIGYVFVRAMHTGLYGRYLLATAIGIILGMASSLSTVRPKGLALFAIFIFSAMGVRELRFWRHLGQNPFDPFPPSLPGKLVQSAGHEDLPIVVCDGLQYLELAYYSPSQLSGRLVYLADEDKELSYVGSNSFARTIKRASAFFPLHVADYSSFTSAHSEFLMYTGIYGSTYWLTDFTREGSLVQLLATGDGFIYLIKMKSSSGDLAGVYSFGADVQKATIVSRTTGSAQRRPRHQHRVLTRAQVRVDLIGP
jgi:hypothetical protein